MGLNGPQINNEIQQLTVRELEEAKKYKLSRSDYVQLRNRLVEQHCDKIIRELVPQIRKKVEEELGNECRAEALAKLNAEKPSRECKLAYIAYLRELESETGALAETASELGDKFQDRYSTNKYVRGGVMTVSWLGLLPTALYLLSNGWSYNSAVFLGVLTSTIIVAAWFSLAYSSTKSFLIKKNQEMRSTSSEYLMLADDARRMRIAVVPTAESTREISESVQAIVWDKKKLDERFCPPVKILNETRKKVRVKMLNEIDPMEVLKAVDDDSQRASSEKWLELEEKSQRQA
jgi:hypothetical protein